MKRLTWRRFLKQNLQHKLLEISQTESSAQVAGDFSNNLQHKLLEISQTIFSTSCWRFLKQNLQHKLLEISQTESSAQVPQQMDVFASALYNVTKLLHLHLYERTVVYKFRNRSRSKTEFCELVLSGSVCWRNQTYTHWVKPLLMSVDKYRNPHNNTYHSV